MSSTARRSGQSDGGRGVFCAGDLRPKAHHIDAESAHSLRRSSLHAPLDANDGRTRAAFRYVTILVLAFPRRLDSDGRSRNWLAVADQQLC